MLLQIICVQEIWRGDVRGSVCARMWPLSAWVCILGARVAAREWLCVHAAVRIRVAVCVAVCVRLGRNDVG